MCGITGGLASSDFTALQAAIAKMTDAMVRRGPDDTGVWVDAHAGIALGHRRLSVVDLSDAGHQPMHSASGRYVIAFNGEIYNHMELRSELEGEGHSAPRALRRGWRGHSDTETLLAGFEAWGVEATLKKTVGMFAIALWDTQAKALILARDRFGEKPLYYGWVGRGACATDKVFVFGSELKSLRAHPDFTNPVNREALALYMRFTYVPAPYSIYDNIFKLEPGCMLTISGGAPIPPSATCTSIRSPEKLGSLVMHRWWALAEGVAKGTQNQITDEVEALHALDDCLQTAVGLQSLADVPLGAFLSGGVDSSIIVALMQQQTMHSVKTFTVGFEEAGFDESPYAKAVAQHLGTDHTELFVTSSETRAVIPHLPAMYDEPFADSSQIPTHLVCKAARQQVTVALSGDAGDELFGGYSRYFWGERIWSWLAWLPYPVRQMLGALITSISVGSWDALGKPFNALLPGTQGIARVGDKAHKLANRLRGVRNLDDFYLSLVSEWQDSSIVVKGTESRLLGFNESDSFGLAISSSLGLSRLWQAEAFPAALGSIYVDSWKHNAVHAASHTMKTLNPIERMMYYDSTTYMPGDILCKVDRAAMAASLETRVPFLDHRVAELAWRLPFDMKVRGNEGKWALRQVLYKYVPRELIERPKVGFGIPVGQWLRGPLRGWAEDLLAESRLQSEGYFYPTPIREKWEEHLSGQRDHTASLWTVLMFQAWLEVNV